MKNEKIIHSNLKKISINKTMNQKGNFSEENLMKFKEILFITIHCPLLNKGVYKKTL